MRKFSFWHVKSLQHGYRPLKGDDSSGVPPEPHSDDTAKRRHLKLEILVPWALCFAMAIVFTVITLYPGERFPRIMPPGTYEGGFATDICMSNLVMSIHC